jgi:hypothetical protein
MKYKITNGREQKQKDSPKVQKKLYRVKGFELSNKYITRSMKTKLSMRMHKQLQAFESV